jgi:SAM-dependent methyltransferase
MKIGFMACFEPEYFPNFRTFAYRSEQSLLEFDLVLWHLEFLHFDYRIRTENDAGDLQQLCEDRNRRLDEIETLLKEGGSLVILLSDPIRIPLNDPLALIPSMRELLGHNKFSDEVIDHLVEEGKRTQVAQDEVLKENKETRDTLDVYAFLPNFIEKPLRKHSVLVKQRSNEIDFRGDSAFLDFWKRLQGVAWYDVFFSSDFGVPLLYKANTQYPVATWLKHRDGNVFLIPNTEYDSSDDYPTFVEAAQSLVAGADHLARDMVEYEWSEQQDSMTSSTPRWYIDPSRIDELRSLSDKKFDLTKLIRLCEELNLCYSHDCFFAVAMLARSIIDHIPPIFGCQTFTEVASNYGGRSLKKSMQNLQNSLRNVADAHLHLPIRSSESLPTRVQVNFSSDIDVLLSEVARILK